MLGITEKTSVRGFAKTKKVVLFILIFFQADEGKMIYFLQKKAIQVKHQPVDKHVV
jgi:hypothetical protein